MDGYLRSPELVFTSGGKIRHGWQETLDKYQARNGSSPATMGRLHFDILEVRPLGDVAAVVLGRWRLTELPAPAGGVFTVVLQQTREGWRVVHDHTSTSTD